MFRLYLSNFVDFKQKLWINFIVHSGNVSSERAETVPCSKGMDSLQGCPEYRSSHEQHNFLQINPDDLHQIYRNLGSCLLFSSQNDKVKVVNKPVGVLLLIYSHVLSLSAQLRATQRPVHPSFEYRVTNSPMAASASLLGISHAARLA